MARVELTKRQREWILARSEYDLGVVSSEWSGDQHKRFEVHHIVPVSWATHHLGETPDEYNNPHRLIVLTQPEHHTIHPDIIPAIENYWRDKKSFEKVFRERRRLIDRGVKYWVATHDKSFTNIAHRRTVAFMRLGNAWPERVRWV